MYLGFTRMIDQIIADNKSNKDCRNQNIIDTTNMCLHLQRKLIDLIGYLFIQVLSEERRLHRDFGNEYDVYCRHTRRF